MPQVPMMARVPTTFSRSGGIDEEAQRQYNQRLIDARIGLYLCSGGTGESHTLTREELRQVYENGVASGKGKVPVWANPPEQHTARATIEHAKLAIDCGVEGVNVYALASLHLMKPTPQELAAYYDEVLGAIQYPVAIAPNPMVGYNISPEMIAGLCHKYPQIVAVNLSGGIPDSYFLQLKPLLKRKVDCYVSLGGSEHTLNLGATGLLMSVSNIIPKTFRRYLDLYAEQKYVEMSPIYADIKRVVQFCSRWWGGGQTRVIKMAMKVLKLPGGEGGMREPYRTPPAEELARFAEGLAALGVPEIDEQSRAAGLKV
jgi:dihydrodipicolinate synthase/N-acetylneuraminate lyase